MDKSFAGSDFDELNSLFGEMMMTEGTYRREKDRCSNSRLPPNFTKKQCENRTNLTQKGGVNFITEKGMAMLAMSVMSAPPHAAQECSKLGVTMLDLARVPRDSQEFCRNLPGKWYSECTQRQKSTRAEFIQSILYK